jgi:hypothetical protein
MTKDFIALALTYDIERIVAVNFVEHAVWRLPNLGVSVVWVILLCTKSRGSNNIPANTVVEGTTHWCMIGKIS